MDVMITRRGGGGAPLNFSIVGGTAQPSNPKENTIWVNTSTEITGWSFSADEPSSPKEGLVWIETVTKSSVGFDALNADNVLMVYPYFARIYTSGKWLDVPVRVYKDGGWQHGLVYIFDSTSNVDEWTLHEHPNGVGGGLWEEDNLMGIGNNTGNNSASGPVSVEYSKYMDLKNYGKLVVEFDGMYGYVSSVCVGISNVSGYIDASYIDEWCAKNAVYPDMVDPEIEKLEVDISKVNAGYIQIFTHNHHNSWYQGTTVYVKKVYLV